MRLPTVIQDCIPDVNLKPLPIYCSIINDIAHHVVDSYLLVTENTSTVIFFLIASLTPPKTVLPVRDFLPETLTTNLKGATTKRKEISHSVYKNVEEL